MNHFLRDMETVRANGRPVVLYGCAKMGHRLYAFLRDFGVDIESVAADRRFLVPGQTFKGRAVTAIEDILESGGRYNYIVAFNPRERREEIRERLLPGAECLLMYDFGYGVIEDAYAAVACYESYAMCFKPQFEEVLSWLEDEKSRKTLQGFIEQKRTGLFGPYCRHYTQNQYFPDDIVTLGRDSVFVDCGAFNGDTVRAFLDKLRREGLSGYRAIHAFEPMAPAFSRLREICKALPNVFCLQKGVWETEETLMFRDGGRESTLADAGGIAVEMTTLDGVLKGAKASFIKMDVEGAELQALRGASETIREHRPALAVCIYHKPEDILTIPRFIKKMHPDYRLFVRGHSRLASNECVLYAV